MDELGEFPVALLDSLRQPLEEGEVRVARKGVSVRFPCAAQVVGATNPCPCGFLGDRRQGCKCSDRSIERYRRRLSGPLLDRFDLHVDLERLDADDLSGPRGESSDVVRARVELARECQRSRGFLNREVPRAVLDEMPFEGAGLVLLRRAVNTLGLSGRGWDRVRRVAVTIADLEGEEKVREAHMAEALGYRGQQ